jgi:hypothetical protein
MIWLVIPGAWKMIPGSWGMIPTEWVTRMIGIIRSRIGNLHGWACLL